MSKLTFATTGGLTVDHENIEGLMPTMEMIYVAKRPGFSVGPQIGDKTAFDIGAQHYAVAGVMVVEGARRGLRERPLGARSVGVEQEPGEAPPEGVGDGVMTGHATRRKVLHVRLHRHVGEVFIGFAVLLRLDLIGLGRR